LGVKLFGNGCTNEAQAAFTKAAVEGCMIESAALVWLGHLSDLADKREQAVVFYEKALQCYPGFPVQHSQWNISLTEEWIELRINYPFTSQHHK